MKENYSYFWKIGNWTIDANSLYNLGISLNADKRFIAIANTTDDLKSGDGQLAKVKNVGGVAMFYSTSADYGIFAYKENKLVFQAGTTNYIAGWNFDENSLYIGTKNNNADQYTNDDKSLTIGANGLRGKAWYINTNGTAKFSSGYIQFNEKADLLDHGTLIQILYIQEQRMIQVVDLLQPLKV